MVKLLYMFFMGRNRLNTQFVADLVMFTAETLNGKLHFMCSVLSRKVSCFGILYLVYSSWGQKQPSEGFLEKSAFKISQNSCWSLFRSEAYNFIKKGTLTQVFSFEFYKIFQSTIFSAHIWTTAFVG